MTAKLTLVNTSNWATDQIVVKREGQPSQVLRRGEQLDLHPPYQKTGVLTLEVESRDTHRRGDRPAMRGTPQVVVIDRPKGHPEGPQS